MFVTATDRPHCPVSSLSDSPPNSFFSSLRTRNFRLFATGQLFSNTGTWVQRIAQDWLVLSLTGSATAVTGPRAKATTYTCQAVTTWVRVSAASTPAIAASADWVTSSTARLG